MAKFVTVRNTAGLGEAVKWLEESVGPSGAYFVRHGLVHEVAAAVAAYVGKKQLPQAIAGCKHLNTMQDAYEWGIAAGPAPRLVLRLVLHVQHNMPNSWWEYIPGFMGARVEGKVEVPVAN